VVNEIFNVVLIERKKRMSFHCKHLGDLKLEFEKMVFLLLKLCTYIYNRSSEVIRKSLINFIIKFHLI